MENPIKMGWFGGTTIFLFPPQNGLRWTSWKCARALPWNPGIFNGSSTKSCGMLAQRCSGDQRGQRGPKQEAWLLTWGQNLSNIIKHHQMSWKVISYRFKKPSKFLQFSTLPAVYTGPFQPGKWTHSSNCLWDSCLVLRSLLQPQQNMAPRTCFCTSKQHEWCEPNSFLW